MVIGLAFHLWLWLAQTPPAPLSYDVYTSAGAGSHEPLPTVVILHGRDDALHGLPHALRNADYPLRVIVPWGPRVRPNGTHAWFRRSELRSPDGEATEIRTAALQVVALLDTLRTSGSVLGRPVLVGYSQGATVALAVSLRAPDAVAEVVAISGHLPRSHLPETLRDHAVTHVLVGERDRVMLAKTSLRQVGYLQELGYAIDAVTFPEQGHGVGVRMRRFALRRVHTALRLQQALVVDQG